MASILQQGVGEIALQFNGKEVSKVSELIMVKGFSTPDINLYHTVVQNIVAKEQIGFSQPIYKVSKLAEECDETMLDKQIPITEKFWDPVDIHIPVEQCYKDLDRTFFVWARKKGKNLPDLTATDAVTFIIETLRNAVLHDAQRIAWFADTLVERVADGGKLKNTESVSDYNHYNGFWKQLFAIMTANPSQRVIIDENSEATKADQLNLGTDVAYNYFEEMLESADSRLYDSTNEAMILCTRRMYQNYKRTLRNKGNDKAFEVLINGIPRPAFDGIPVFYYDIWDRAIQDFDNGTVFDLPNRAVLTTKEMLQYGVDSVSSLGDFNAGYDIKSNKVIIRGQYKADAKCMLDHMFVTAY